MNLQTTIENKGKSLLKGENISVLSSSFVDKITSASDRFKSEAKSQGEKGSIHHRGAELFYTLANKNTKEKSTQIPDKEIKEVPQPVKETVKVIKEQSIENVPTTNHVIENALKESLKKGQELAKQAEEMSKALAAERLKNKEIKQTVPIDSGIEESSTLEAKTNIPSPASQSISTPVLENVIGHTQVMNIASNPNTVEREALVIKNSAPVQNSPIASKLLQPTRMEHVKEKHIQKIDEIKRVLENTPQSSSPNERETVLTKEVVEKIVKMAPSTSNENILGPTSEKIVETNTNDTPLAQKLKAELQHDSVETIAPEIISAVNAMPLNMAYHAEHKTTENDPLMQALLQEHENNIESVEKIVALALEESSPKPQSFAHIPSVERTHLEMTHTQNTTKDIERISDSTSEKKSIDRPSGEATVVSDLTQRFSNVLPQKQKATIDPIKQAPISMTHAQKSNDVETIKTLIENLEASGTLSIHSDAHSNQIVDAQKAKAITVDNKILLGSEYTNLSDPKTQAVLAHEMVHVHQIKKAKEKGEKITPEKIVAFEKEATKAQNSLFEHASKAKVHSISIPQSEIVTQTIKKGLSETSADLVKKLAGNKEGTGGERQVISAEMKHPAPAPISNSVPSTPSNSAVASVTSSSGIPAMAASMDDGEESVQLSASNTENNQAKSTSPAMDMDLLTEQIFMRIKDRLTVERERFHK